MRRERFCRWCRTAAATAAGGWFGRHAEVQGELVHFVEAGSGQPVLLLHGFLEWSYTWRHNLLALAGSGRIIAPDLRGFGLTERGPHRGHTLGDQARLIRDLMDALDVDQAVLCGHSMGGEIALRFALEYPDRVRALILVDASGYVRRAPHPAERWLLGVPGAAALLLRAVMLNRRFVRRALEFGYGSPDRIAPADVAAYLLPARAPGSVRTLVRILRETDLGSYADRLGQVGHRSLLIWGGRDRVVPPEHGRRLAEALPNSELVLFQNAGHLPHEEEPEAFNSAVLSFLHSLQ